MAEELGRAKCLVPADGDVKVRQYVDKDPDNQPANDGVEHCACGCVGVRPSRGGLVRSRRLGNLGLGAGGRCGHHLVPFPTEPDVTVLGRFLGGAG
jgi:hypothetical protein